MNISLISYISCIMSKLSYFDNSKFLNKYIQIFNIPELEKQIKNLKNSEIENINNINIHDISKINKKINKINYSENIEVPLSSSTKYICISTSNYSSVYITADKKINTICISFRGTYSPKSTISYLNFNSLLPFKPCKTSKNAFLLGIFKITAEIFYTIQESIHYLNINFLNNSNPTIITTGHSLGGACSQIFSYLWVKNTNLKIHCITFGCPRMMNGPLIDEFNTLVLNKYLFFKRYITNGDPIPKLPIKTKYTSKQYTYYHPDDYSEKMNSTAFTCKNTKNDNVICNLKNKTKKNKINKKFHGTYLGINFKHSSEGITNIHKEIKRDSIGNTICRIIIGDNKEIKASFFNLNNIKIINDHFISEKINKLKKILITDYTHQDIYMNKNIFKKIINEGTILQNDNLNQLSTDNYIKINIDENSPKHPELYCL